jgi:hypothetical protein
LRQFPAQLPTGLQDEILGNVNSIVAFGFGGKDAQVMRREFLQKVSREDGERLEPVPAPALVELARGEAYAKFAGGRAVKIVTPPPRSIRNPGRTEEVIAASWERHGASPNASPPGSAGQSRSGPRAERAPGAGAADDFLE